MFGYIMLNKPDLKPGRYEEYHSYYCGLCRALADRAGSAGKLTLSFDMTFLYILLSGLYEPEEETSRRYCALHPGKKQTLVSNEFGAYAADMNLLLSYYNLMDNWADDKDRKSLALANKIKKTLDDIKEKYPRQTKAVSDYVANLSVVEKQADGLANSFATEENDTCSSQSLQADAFRSLDCASGLTGNMLAEIFAFKDDEWSGVLKRLGFFLGKFIYLMDAWEDRESDKKKNSYNPWLLQGHEVSFEEAGDILNLMMSECSCCFEALPILKNAEILRNIIYSGVWIKFEEQRKTEAKRAEKKTERDN